jgi:hypothetical protein
MPDGEFVGSVGTVAGNGATVTWQVRCGTKASGGPIPTGAFTLQTAAMTVEVESDPSNPAAGHVSEVPLSSWVDIASQGEWTVVVAQNRATQIRSSSAPTDHDPCA